MSPCAPSPTAGNYRWIGAHDPSLLDYPRCELLLIGGRGAWTVSRSRRAWKKEVIFVWFSFLLPPQLPLLLPAGPTPAPGAADRLVRGPAPRLLSGMAAGRSPSRCSAVSPAGDVWLLIGSVLLLAGQVDDETKKHLDQAEHDEVTLSSANPLPEP